MKFFITIFVHSPYPRIVVLHAFLFLSNQFIKKLHWNLQDFQGTSRYTSDKVI